jgi:hypothetical protein
MIAAIWSAIGILAAGLFATIHSLNARMDSRMDTGFARMDLRFAQVDERFARLEARMDQGFARMDSRLDAVNARLDAHIQPHTG